MKLQNDKELAAIASSKRSVYKLGCMRSNTNNIPTFYILCMRSWTKRCLLSLEVVWEVAEKRYPLSTESTHYQWTLYEEMQTRHPLQWALYEELDKQCTQCCFFMRTCTNNVSNIYVLSMRSCTKHQLLLG